MAVQNVHAQEAKTFSDKIYSFESANLNLTREKDRLFDQLEMRQAELESSNTHLETLQSQTTEYQYQIRELSDRVALLEGELTDAQREANPASGTGMTAEEVACLMSAAEAKYEARLAELRGQLDTIEKERNEADAEWSHKVSAKALEVEELKKVIGKSQKSEVDHEAVEEQLREEIATLKEDVRGYQRQQVEFQRQMERIKESEVSPWFCIETVRRLRVNSTGRLTNTTGGIIGQGHRPRIPYSGVQEQGDPTTG